MKQNSTKTITLLSGMILLLIASTTNVQAQHSDDDDGPKNIVKWNVPALILKNYSFQYERSLNRKISFAVGFRFSPKSKLPFSSVIEDQIEDDDELKENIKKFKTGNFAITPEVRFYMGQGFLKGFYIAPFARYAKYTAEVPFGFEVEDPTTNELRTETIPLDGNVTALSAGVLLGAQWIIGKRVAIDWWILGPNYGTSSGNISGNSDKPLSSEEQAALRDTLEGLEDLPIVKAKSTVDANGAKVDFDGPWGGLRSGITVGIRF